jgi:hypothetical protein
MANLSIDCPLVQESFLAAGDDEKSCCVFEDLDRRAEGFRRMDGAHTQ